MEALSNPARLSISHLQHPAKRCTFYTTRATLARKDLAAGARSIAFTGRVKGKALKAASYRATVTAKDPVKNTGKAVTATFTIVTK